MATGSLQTRHVKASSSSGQTGKVKKEGYAAGTVPSAMIGTKAGKVDGKPYSGPNCARPEKF